MGSQEDVLIEKQIVINRSSSVLFKAWRNMENVPQMLDFVENVLQLGDNLWRWTVRLNGNERATLDAEITNEEHNHSLEWRSTGNTDIMMIGVVQLSPGRDHGTNLRLILRFYFPPLNDSRPDMLGPEIENRIVEGLERFKIAIEADEFPRPRDNKPSWPDGLDSGDGKKRPFESL